MSEHGSHLVVAKERDFDSETAGRSRTGGDDGHARVLRGELSEWLEQSCPLIGGDRQPAVSLDPPPYSS
jgi:hypothetical protein